MNSGIDPSDLQELARLACESDPALVAEVLRTADRLRESGENRLAVDVLERLAKGLVNPNCLLPPLVRCHVFSRLAGPLCALGRFEEAATWLRRAVTLAEESKLSELSRRDLQGILQRVLQRGEAQGKLRSQDRARRETGEETVVRTAPSAETDAAAPSMDAGTRNALNRLSAELRQVFELRVIQKISADEIARLLDISRTEVLWLIRAATQEFDRAMSEAAEHEQRTREEEASPSDSSESPRRSN